MGDIADAATFLRRTNRRMEHQTAIITLVRGLASLLVATQVLGVQFERTFVARWIGSDGGVHVEARTYNEIVSSPSRRKPTRKQSIDDVMRLAKKIGGDRVLNGVRSEVEKVWKVIREERDGLILYAQTFDDGNVKELINEMRIGLSASEINLSVDFASSSDGDDDDDCTGVLFRVPQQQQQQYMTNSNDESKYTIESLKFKFQERLLQITKTAGRNITIPFGFVAGKILREECEAWGFGKTSKDALNGNGGCVMRVAVLPTRDKTHRMRFRQVKEGELMSAMDLLHARKRRKSSGSSGGGF